MNEADMFPGLVVPELQGFVHKPPKRAAYILRFQRSFPRAVVKVKADWQTEGQSIREAKEYTALLQLKSACIALNHAFKRRIVVPASFTILWRAALTSVLYVASGCSTRPPAEVEHRASYRAAEMVDALNALRDDIDARYGFRNGAPRINLGPCGRFARDFRECWNARFREPVTIAYIMADSDASNCFHVLVKLPDGRYFDGGNGVMTAAFLKTLCPDGHIEEMKDFDFELLDRRSYGLGRTYPECPNYSDAFTLRVIERRLSELVNHPQQQ